MLRRGRGPKPTKGRGNIDKSENNFHIGSSSVGRKSKIQTYHAGKIHLDSGDSRSGVVQPKEGKEEATSSQSSQPIESGSCEGETMVDHEDHAEETSENQVNEEQSNFEFPIVDPDSIAQMKNIPPLTLPHFHGKVHEYLDSFLFEFDILCRSYDYSTEAQKLRLFPATLKDSALHWFMGLEGNTITSWDQMKRVFLSKYQKYCKTRDM